jgi:hypothetical protein
VSERGYDIEDLDAEIAADQARAKTLGIELNASAKKPAADKPNSEGPNVDA